MRTSEKVTVSPTRHADYPGGYVVRWPGPNGKRVAKLFHNETEAKAWAKARRKELGDVGLAFGSITEIERAAVTYWRGFLATVPDNAPPDLLSILQDFGERWKSTRSSVTVAAAVDAYECAKTSEGLRPMSLQSIRTRCGRFAHDFGPRIMCSVTTAEISDWILGLRVQQADGDPGGAQVGLQTRRNHRLAISGLFNYAKTRGWVAENPVSDAARPRPPKTRPGILRPGEVARLFAALESCAPELVPFWALRFFAGIREQEILRMDWSMVDLSAGEIHLPDVVTKTGHARTLKVQPALAAFLAPHVRRDGPPVPFTQMARTYRLKKALGHLQAEDKRAVTAKAAGRNDRNAFPVPMPTNCARHSFATYHLMAFRHAGETAIQLGHGGSPEMLHRHYKGCASEAEAKAFWSIRPVGSVQNVVGIVQPDDVAVTAPKRRKA